MIKGILPDPIGRNSQALCFMIYDWPKLVGSELIDFIEQLFIEYGQTPFEGTGGCGKSKSHGSYKRVKKRLAGFLDNSADDNYSDIRVFSEKVIDDDFFPCNICVAWAAGSTCLKKGIIAIREELECNPDSLVDRCGQKLFELTGHAHAGVWKFPAAFSPEAYLSSVHAIPKGTKSLANKEYSDRISRWRDNTRSLEFRVSNGYFREIYPINFLLEAHLKMPFSGKQLKSFMENNGVLKQLEFNHKLYRWDVPESNLSFVRERLEDSGLVLSSAHQPLMIN
jgi:hypothetical protein